MAGNEFNPLPQDFIKKFEDILEYFEKTRENLSEKSVIEDSREGFDGLMSDMRDPPKLTVAVYGDTGSGKSSLLNAILDQPNLVPKAGMGEACTSVAIRIEENKDRDDFAAEIEFLSREEWDREFRVLNVDLTYTDTEDGLSVSTTFEEARAMIKAVYDIDVSNIGELMNTENEVTEKLGSTLVITENDAQSLQDKLLKYIDSSHVEEGGIKYWPIVKQITLRLPTSDLCKSGMVFIDLPGVGDSNPARDGVAKKYKDSCDVLMVVTTIHRAVDSKTAKAVIGERMFRQVKMDGRRTVLVCTHADVVDVEEVIRKLNIPEAEKWTEEFDKFEKEERELEMREAELDAETERTPAELDVHIPRKLSLSTMQRETQRLVVYEEDTTTPAQQIEEYVSDLPPPPQQEEEYVSLLPTPEEYLPRWLRSLKEVRNSIKKLETEKTSRCAVAKKEHVKKKMKSSEADQKDIQVFCVSSKDYHKLQVPGPPSDHEPPTFMKVEQTEIPDLRDVLKRATEKKRELKSKSIKKEFRSLVSGLYTYLTNMELGGRKLQETIEGKILTFERETRKVISSLDGDIDKLLQDKLGSALADGVQAAEAEAPNVCASWSDRVNKNDRCMPFNTFKATVSRDGELNSKHTRRSISMNMDLCDPLSSRIEDAWTDTFSEDIWISVIKDQLRSAFSTLMDDHTDEVLKFIRHCDHDVEALSTNIIQLKMDAVEKLHRLDNIWMSIQQWSRQINAYMPVKIKEEMQPTYAKCLDKTGKGQGAFQNLKDTMAEEIERLKMSMFQNLSDYILQALKRMKNEVVYEVNDILMKICADHRKQIEALWGGQQIADSLTNVRQYREDLDALKDDIERLIQDKGNKRKHQDGDEGLSSGNKIIKQKV